MSLIKFVTFGLGREGVKGNSDNVTEYDVFFFDGVPKSIKAVKLDIIGKGNKGIKFHLVTYGVQMKDLQISFNNDKTKVQMTANCIMTRE